MSLSFLSDQVLFEPTSGCPHLQPLELIEMATKKASEIPTDQWLESEVIITEYSPDNMFKGVKTTLHYSGQAWMISGVERLLSVDAFETTTLIQKKLKSS